MTGLVPCLTFTLGLCHIDTHTHSHTSDLSRTCVVLEITVPCKPEVCVFLTSVMFISNKLKHGLS